MRDIYEYFLYGHLLISNVELHMLDMYNGQTILGEVTLNVLVQEKKDFQCLDDIYTEFSEDYSLLVIGDKVEYGIFSKQNLISVKTSDLVWFESTILNLPFAILFAMNDMLLLHASSLINVDTIIPICASKGTGKTTLSVGLSNHFPFYSDDTLLIELSNKEVQCFSGSGWVKLNKDSYNLIGAKEDFDSLKKNVQGKAYYSLRPMVNASHYELNTLFFLHREGEKVKCEKITGGFNRKLLLHSNICGTGTLGYEYCKMIDRNSVFNFLLDNMNFFKITMCDNLDEFPQSVKEVKAIISSITRV